MTNYTRGRALEWDAQHDLETNGYDTIRAASSKGIADVIGFKPGQTVFIQAKTNGRISPADRVQLLRLASLVPGGVPIVVSRPRVTYRRLTGVGPKDWVPWTSDEVGTEVALCGLEACDVGGFCQARSQCRYGEATP